MKRLFNIHVLTVVVATSYITLGIASPDRAAQWWSIYAGVTFVLAIATLFCRR